MIFRKKFDFTVISDDFIKSYMPNANGTYVKVYLYWEMCAQSGDFSFDVRSAAKALDLSMEDVEMAKEYWLSKGVYSEENEDIKVSSEEKSEPLEKEAPLDLNVDMLLQANKIPEFNKMFSDIDLILGRETSSNEKMRALNFMTDYSMNPDVITEAFRISVERDKKNFNYAEGILRNWYNKGITNKEKLDEYLKINFVDESNYREIARLAGLSGNLPEASKELVNKWINTFGFDMALIREGLGRLTQTNKPSFKYLDKIFESWYEKGIRSAVELEEKDKNPKSKKNAFHEFEQREEEFNKEEYDYYNQQKIEKMLGEEEEDE